MALMLACPSAVNAQGRWKGIDLFFLTDAFQDDVPKGVAVCDNDTFEYGAYKSTETKKYDAHGFYLQDGNRTYENTYYPDGRIQERKIYDDGKLSYRDQYEYKVDEKGPVVTIQRYDKYGDKYMFTGYQNNNFVQVENGGVGYTELKLNAKHKPVKGTITVTNGIQKITFQANYTYNNKGYLETKTELAGYIGNAVSYAGYQYDINGVWISRCDAEGVVTKRTFMTQEEYDAKIAEEAQIAAEVKRLEELKKQEEERRIKAENQKLKDDIALRGFALDSELKKPGEFYFKLKEPSTPGVSFSEQFTATITKDRTISIASQKIADLLEFSRISAALILFTNEPVECVNSTCAGKMTVKCNYLYNSAQPLEIKLKHDKKLGKWYIKDVDKFIEKNGLTRPFVDLLEEKIKEIGDKDGFKKDKIYLKLAYCYDVQVDWTWGKCKHFGENQVIFPTRVIFTEDKDGNTVIGQKPIVTIGTAASASNLTENKTVYGTNNGIPNTDDQRELIAAYSANGQYQKAAEIFDKYLTTTPNPSLTDYLVASGRWLNASNRAEDTSV